MPRRKKSRPTCQTRIAEDLSVMMTVLRWVDGVKNTDRLDSLVRPSVEQSFKLLPANMRREALARAGFVEGDESE